MFCELLFFVDLQKEAPTSQNRQNKKQFYLFLSIEYNNMNRLIDIYKTSDIDSKYHNTPIEWLLEYHNINKTLGHYTKAQLLVGMCMDNRKRLRIPDNFAFIIRTGGANLSYSEFKVSYAIAVGDIRHIVLISHNNCGMVHLNLRKDQFIQGLIKNAGWDKPRAEQHFDHFAPMFEIGNSIDFIISEAQRLRLVYPQITIVPMHYKVDDNRLYLIEE
jgi:carbonic anhydrase